MLLTNIATSTHNQFEVKMKANLKLVIITIIAIVTMTAIVSIPTEDVASDSESTVISTAQVVNADEEYDLPNDVTFTTGGSITVKSDGTLNINIMSGGQKISSSVSEPIIILEAGSEINISPLDSKEIESETEVYFNGTADLDVSVLIGTSLSVDISFSATSGTSLTIEKIVAVSFNSDADITAKVEMSKMPTEGGLKSIKTIFSDDFKAKAYIDGNIDVNIMKMFNVKFTGSLELNAGVTSGNYMITATSNAEATAEITIGEEMTAVMLTEDMNISVNCEKLATAVQSLTNIAGFSKALIENFPEISGSAKVVIRTGTIDIPVEDVSISVGSATVAGLVLFKDGKMTIEGRFGLDSLSVDSGGDEYYEHTDFALGGTNLDIKATANLDGLINVIFYHLSYDDPFDALKDLDAEIDVSGSIKSAKLHTITEGTEMTFVIRNASASMSAELSDNKLSANVTAGLDSFEMIGNIGAYGKSYISINNVSISAAINDLDLTKLTGESALPTLIASINDENTKASMSSAIFNIGEDTGFTEISIGNVSCGIADGKISIPSVSANVNIDYADTDVDSMSMTIDSLTFEIDLNEFKLSFSDINGTVKQNMVDATVNTITLSDVTVVPETDDITTIAVTSGTISLEKGTGIVLSNLGVSLEDGVTLDIGSNCVLQVSEFSATSGAICNANVCTYKFTDGDTYSIAVNGYTPDVSFPRYCVSVVYTSDVISSVILIADEGYEFSEWKGGLKYELADGVATLTEYKGTVKANITGIEYSLIVDGADAVKYAAGELAYITTPTKDGMVFIQFVDANGNHVDYSKNILVMPSNDLTISSVFGVAVTAGDGIVDVGDNNFSTELTVSSGSDFASGMFRLNNGILVKIYTVVSEDIVFSSIEQNSNNKTLTSMYCNQRAYIYYGPTTIENPTVYHVNENGNKCALNTELVEVDGKKYAMFCTEDFSTFYVESGTAAPTVNTDMTTGADAGDTDFDDGGNSGSGSSWIYIVIAIVVIIVALFVVLLLLQKSGKLPFELPIKL